MITLLISLFAQTNSLEKITIDVNGLKREFLVHIPKTRDAKPRPVVFAFHGHGGSMQNAASKFKVHTLWPDAVAVYMQGFPTTGITDPSGTKNGWQKVPGDYEDRDVKFFDAVNAWVHQKTSVDDKALFSTGHSNGGAFTYLLWTTHPKLFGAIAPSAAGGKAASGTEPIKTLHMTGRNDRLVSFELQSRTTARVRRINQCDEKSFEWIPNATRWNSKVGAHFTHYVFDGGHSMPDNLAPMIVKFFQEVRAESK
jgi:polyhydroxybutyrate depolymerase